MIVRILGLFIWVVIIIKIFVIIGVIILFYELFSMCL